VIVSAVNKASETGTIHQNLYTPAEMVEFRLYMLIGGMPQAVEAYLEHNNPKGDKLIRLK
jgi:hypothetical protein